MTQRTKVRRYFDTDDRWKTVYTSDDWLARLAASRQDYVLRMVKEISLPRGSRVLDVGCGVGVTLAKLVEHGYDAVGVDSSSGMIEAARSLEQEHEHPVTDRLVLGDIEALPFCGGCFELVICAGVLSYLPEDEKALSEIRRVLKRGAFAIITVPSYLTMANFPSLVRTKARTSVRRLLGSSGNGADSIQPGEGRSSQQGVPYEWKSYNPVKFDRMVRSHGFKKVASLSHGFRPLIFRGRSILSDSGAFGLSTRIERLLLRVNLPLLRWLGEFYILAVQKT